MIGIETNINKIKTYTMKIDLLEQAENKITIKMLDNMENGETIILNERFELYKYFGDYTIGAEEDYIEPDYFVLKDKKYDDETFCVQYGYKDEIVLTDCYGYDDNENFYSLK